MKSNLYKFTIEHLENSKGHTVETKPLVFETKNHDDIFKIIENIKSKIKLEEEDSTAFVIGLKLFSEVMLKNKDIEPYKEFLPHLKDFMKKLKKA
jgi:hypothetical protein